jgi:soluble cytochrome b562
MSKTYQIITPESAKEGDFSETGFEYEDQGFDSLYEMADEIRNEGYVEPSDSGEPNKSTWYTTVDPVRDYSTGEETYYSFHPKLSSGEEAKELKRLLNLDRRKFYDKKDKAEGSLKAKVVAELKKLGVEVKDGKVKKSDIKTLSRRAVQAQFKDFPGKTEVEKKMEVALKSLDKSLEAGKLEDAKAAYKDVVGLYEHMQKRIER